MNVAILEILGLRDPSRLNWFYHALITKQFASVMPQAIAVWCRQAGCNVRYGTYFGVGDPLRCIPSDSDVVFLSCYTVDSPLAYALSKLLRARDIITVLGGPHAKAFPTDACRFFDYVVGECDQALLLQILHGEHAPGFVQSAAPPSAFPSVEERLPYIKTASYFYGRVRSPASTVAMLSSTGCPYTCSFCPDGKSKYRLLAQDQVLADLRFVAAHLPGAFVAFHDPNFGIKFDETLGALEAQEKPVPYMMESSLSILKHGRMKRLKDTNCVFVAPGVESFFDFSNKSGAGPNRSGEDKLNDVVAQFRELYENVGTIQANFMFGLDGDTGRRPVDLLKQFMDQTPFVWPTINIPMPYGGTDLHGALLREERIIEAMPFRFYYQPYCVTKIRHYGPIEYYRLLIEMYEHATSTHALRKRIATRRTKTEKLIEGTRVLAMRHDVFRYRRIMRALQDAPELRAFHVNGMGRLPPFYRAEYARGLGRYAAMLTDADRTPVLA